MRTDGQLGVCGDEETETGLAHTPRYEPSWFYQEVPSEMVDRCLRVRSRGGLDEAATLWLHKHLVALGHAANAHSCHFMAHSWFECAYALKDGASELISSINMRLRLGQATLAKQLYERVLQQREVALIFMLTDAQREVATRKLAEAKAAMAARAAGSLIATQEGCMPRPCVTLAHPHLVTLVPTLTLTHPQPEPEPEPELEPQPLAPTKPSPQALPPSFTRTSCSSCSPLRPRPPCSRLPRWRAPCP